MSALPSGSQRVFLVGMMGAGKTTIGRLVAGRLGWAYLDSDEMVMAATGRSVPEIFATDGEPAFRAEETKALLVAVGYSSPVVVSVAGGAVLDPGNRQLLEATEAVVWLRARIETLAARVGDGHDRPLLAGDPLGVLTRLEAERRPYYQEIATVVLDVDECDPADIATEIVDDLGYGS